MDLFTLFLFVYGKPMDCVYINNIYVQVLKFVNKLTGFILHWIVVMFTRVYLTVPYYSEIETSCIFTVMLNSTIVKKKKKNYIKKKRNVFNTVVFRSKREG